MKLKVEALEKKLEALEINTELLNTKSSIVVQRTAFSVLDRWFIRTGAAMVRPSGSTFSFRVSTGVGAYIGGGRYFGRNHVAELGIDYDLYLSTTARYRLEFHLGRANFTFGPVIGFKQKLIQLQPWGNNISNPDLIKSNFFLLGALIGIPIGRVLVSVEMDYLFNSQVVVNALASAHVLF